MSEQTMMTGTLATPPFFTGSLTFFFINLFQQKADRMDAFHDHLACILTVFDI